MFKKILLMFIMLMLPVQATALPTYFPKVWKVGQKVHVQFVNFSDEDKQFLIDYIKPKIEALNLDVEPIFDDNITRPDGLLEGIRITNVVGTTTVCFKTSTVYGLTQDYSEWVMLKAIKIDTTCLGGGRNRGQTITLDGITYDEEIYWANVIFHEFGHGLGADHIKYIAPMPAPLMLSTNELFKKPVWTFADQWQLKRMYSRDRLVNYKRMRFRRADIGKTAYLIHGNKSVSFTINFQSELLPYLKLSSYRRVVK